MQDKDRNLRLYGKETTLGLVRLSLLRSFGDMPGREAKRVDSSPCWQRFFSISQAENVMASFPPEGPPGIECG